MFDKENLKYIIKYLILFLIFAFITLFLCSSAMALQVVVPDSTKSINGSIWYGYNLPTRPTNFDGSTSASVSVNLTGYKNSSYTYLSGEEKLLYLRDIDSRIIDEVNLMNESLNRDFEVQKVWTNDFKIGDSYYGLTSYDFYYAIGFRPSAFTTDINQMFEDGYSIYELDTLPMYHDYAYSYDFDIVYYNFDNTIWNDNELGANFQTCQMTAGSPNDYMNCITSNNNITSQTIVSNDNIVFKHYSILFNANSWKFGFNKYALDNNSSLYSIEGNNLLFNINDFNIYDGLKVIISQPYNITFWTTNNNISCTNSCWTQENTDNNQRINNDGEYLINTITDAVDNFDYFGFSGIIHYIYNFIIGLLQDSNNSCVELEVPVLSTLIKLPSSCTFWNREDISNFKSFYEMFFTGLVALYLGFKIYNDILNIYNPTSNISDEVIKL